MALSSIDTLQMRRACIAEVYDSDNSGRVDRCSLGDIDKFQNEQRNMQPVDFPVLAFDLFGGIPKQ